MVKMTTPTPSLNIDSPAIFMASLRGLAFQVFGEGATDLYFAGYSAPQNPTAEPAALDSNAPGVAIGQVTFDDEAAVLSR